MAGPTRNSIRHNAGHWVSRLAGWHVLLAILNRTQRTQLARNFCGVSQIGTSRAIGPSIDTRGLCRHAGARPTMLLVSRVGADVEADRAVRSAAGEAGRRHG